MFYHLINPVLVSFGPIEIRYYGLLYFLGFIFAYFYFKYHAKKKTVKNFDEDIVDSFLLYFLIGSIVGARLLDFVFYNPGILFSDPLEVFRVWNGGMTIHGGIIGAMFSGWLFVKKYKISFFKMADIIIVPLTFLLFIGRIANYINGELWGTLSNNSLCVDYSLNPYINNPPKGCRHPYQLYASLKNLLVAGALLIVQKTTKLKEGLLFWWGILLYNAFRFLVDFTRQEAYIVLGLTMGQILCVAFSLVAIFFITKTNSNNFKKFRLKWSL